MLALPPALAPLAAWAQFVCWYAYPHPDKSGKFNKFPCRWDTGALCDAQDPANWTDTQTALAMHQLWDRGHGSGAGFVFTEADPYFFLDIDGAWEGEPGEPGAWSDLATQLLARLPGAAIEVSHSGKGLHAFGRYTRISEHASKNTPLGLELYHARRFVALTGTHARGSTETDCTASLELIAAQYFAPTVTGDAANWTTEPVPEWDTALADDDVLLERAMRSGLKSAAAAFGEGQAITFRDLWENNADKFAATWADGGRSEADIALANHLAFWTGKNCERIERLMRRSGLARDKWDTHRTYLAGTILKACAFTRNVAMPRAEPEIAPPPPPPAPEVLAGAAVATGRRLRPKPEYMDVLAQLEHFAGCVYVKDSDRIWSAASGDLLKRTAFDIEYGGYIFVLDPMSSKTTTSAWEAFTLSRVHEPLKVADVCFRPELPPGSIVTTEGRPLVNTYTPHECVAIEGDVEPYLDLLRRQFPIEEDRRILINYMASLVQNPGVKFQWWPVLQGVKGNGKTAHIMALTYAVGPHYTHLPNTAKMARGGMNFNGWVFRNLFIGMEEVRFSNHRDFLEEFKVVVTNDRNPVENKGVDEVTRDNRVNGLLCTNHLDGVPIAEDERRYAVFWSAQQTLADMERDGLGGDYFPRFYRWFKGEGRAVIAHFLKTFAVEEAYNPATLSHRAPKTSSTSDAINASHGTVEQEIREAMEEGRPGFAGGWVSSIMLDHLLDRLRVKIPRNRRRDIMKTLGYDRHPGLRDGRVDSIVTPDGGKPTLYVREGHLALNLTKISEIAAAYSKAQEPGAQQAAQIFSLTPRS